MSVPARLIKRNNIGQFACRNVESSNGPQIVVPKSDLPHFYELGWRVSWFEGDRVGVVWPNSVENAREMQRAHAERLLEGAA